jgi:hypothetical protein
LTKVVEGRMAFLAWAYEDASVRVRDGADSYLIEDGKIVAQTIHSTGWSKNSARGIQPRTKQEMCVEVVVTLA